MNRKNFDKFDYLNILKGNYNKIPKYKSKIVRIFLSSTFTGKFDLE